MELNADFSKRVSVHAATLAWTPSPMAGVERRMDIGVRCVAERSEEKAVFGQFGEVARSAYEDSRRVSGAGIGDGVGTVPSADLPIDVDEMAFHGRDGKCQLGGNLLIRRPGCNGSQDLHFSRREPVWHDDR